MRTNFFRTSLCIILLFSSSISFAKSTTTQSPSPAPSASNNQEKAPTVKLLAFSGSTRKDSYNQKALALLARAAIQAGAQVTLINLSDYPMPIYDGDLEAKQGLPANVKKLQALINSHDGILIASPEYNGLPTPLLKNTLDWASRPNNNDPNSGLNIFKGKVAALISASPGQGGGSRGLPIAAQLLSNLGMVVTEEKVTIKNCMDKFDATGELNDKSLVAAIHSEGRNAVLRAMKAKKK